MLEEAHSKFACHPSGAASTERFAEAEQGDSSEERSEKTHEWSNGRAMGAWISRPRKQSGQEEQLCDDRDRPRHTKCHRNDQRSTRFANR